MPTLIKNIAGQHQVEFDDGRIDKWCVYLKRNGQSRYAPHDTEYFEFFRIAGERYGSQRVYNDFVQIYGATKNVIDPVVLNSITALAEGYGSDAIEMEIWFSVIYGGMIAEENKTNMILKKRVKRLGMHQVLTQNIAPAEAARFSVGKKWRDLDVLMRKEGF
jgi:hypothetical protein